MIRVLIADDQTLIRTAVRELVRHEPDLEVVGEAADGAEALAQSRLLLPDVVLMDIRMPVLDGIEATRAICADPGLSTVRILILTTFEEDEYVVQALRAGAGGFVGKGTEAADLMRAIRTIHQGDALLSPTATQSLIRRYVLPAAPGRAAAVPPSLAHLTDREREVLTLVARGQSNEEIAVGLFISPLTAKTHINRTMAKLYAHDRAQLVVIAYESGLLVPGAGG
ncbi:MULTISPECIES: response regulator transcription factor [Cryobacterium]|uniref:Response regulator transcription factor n=1 Tax=Cryobacterium glucosi TaxID=1259175 RepID=A0ABY2IS31_9MICO|nr:MULTISPECIES: response regulator transcription factor [Cryobacterium]TFB98803.1 response regulator transcription factor [Cryobacterium sp. MDB2-A-1]TFC04281.1 response regulator transcription factor [Cryobacterium sp. MDB2-33-2]TFC14947.1 response regulator transcription factor [Cryobacterium sp. MDB2-A-2]TFC16453.1 response regulator transcription factor [Cryobacterium sp. MDB2-10]TFC21180.1 response regulator transcription factor [Cryobacterium glucosi]